MNYAAHAAMQQFVKRREAYEARESRKEFLRAKKVVEDAANSGEQEELRLRRAASLTREVDIKHAREARQIALRNKAMAQKQERQRKLTELKRQQDAERTEYRRKLAISLQWFNINQQQCMPEQDIRAENLKGTTTVAHKHSSATPEACQP